jgi:hypothetical protein
VVRVLGYRSGGPDSIPGTTKKKVVGLERGPLSLVNTIEELRGRKSSGSGGLGNREYGRGIHHFAYVTTHYPQKLALTSLISGGRSVGIVRSPTQVTKFVCLYYYGRVTKPKQFSLGNLKG